MGQRLAPILAVCFMRKIKEPMLARLSLMYRRYIDDCCNALRNIRVFQNS